jgi:hypothetical protein
VQPLFICAPGNRLPLESTIAWSVVTPVAGLQVHCPGSGHAEGPLARTWVGCIVVAVRPIASTAIAVSIIEESVFIYIFFIILSSSINAF